MAFFVPWLVFFTIKRFISGVCLFLQITLISWIPAITMGNYCHEWLP
ncbi:hypothetical protein [Helicobacter cetorum]|nr:hypothetical protein [Helicobacter cetorum]